MRSVIILSVIIGALAACETSVNPRTGEKSTRATLGNEEALQERWKRCTEFRSPSICEQRLGWKP